MSNTKEAKKWFLKGLRDGIPIAAGYFAVSFALGITAKKTGLTWYQATLASLLCNASAGEYAGFEVIASKGSYITMALITAIISARYMLMSVTLSQKLSPGVNTPQRLMVGFWVTDEIFGASSTVPGRLNPHYNYGLAICSLSFWALGTCIGVVTGSRLPPGIVTALGVLLYGMFLAIIMPEGRKNKKVGVIILLSMALSWACSVMPVVSKLSEGTRIIILTLVIAGAAALIFPVNTDDGEGEK